MLTFPKSAAFGRRFPKQKFYEHLEVDPQVKRLLVEQVKLIVWAYKLSPQTVNLSPGQAVGEIQVFQIALTGPELDERVTQLMDRQIPYHLLFLLERPDGLQRLRIGYKEASQSGHNAFQLRQSYQTDWVRPEGLSLDLTALDMDGLYESIVRQIAGDAITAPEAETLKAAVEQTQEKEKRLRQIEALRAKMRKEKSLARQMEIRREIMKLEERGATNA